jgi:hypothetical protein
LLVKKGSVSWVWLLLAGCGSSGTGLSSFVNDYAASYCHFAYHCCTPSDRANPENPFAVTAMAEQTYGFATEQGCATAFGAQAEIAFQPYEDSVSAKRMSYDQADGQACLSAIDAAAATCNPNALWSASQTGGACDALAFFAGLVPAGGECTMSEDCAVGDSICTPVDGGIFSAGGTQRAISGAATCASPAPAGAMCSGNGCAVGTCCSYFNATTCVAYVAEGAMCDPGCEMAPCDPTADYCDSQGTDACQPLIASGDTCNPYYQGTDCRGFNCVPDINDPSGTIGTCQSEAPVIQICVGNPNGF